MPIRKQKIILTFQNFLQALLKWNSHRACPLKRAKEITEYWSKSITICLQSKKNIYINIETYFYLP
ncbi:MAG: hypothetical protein A2Y62_15080 [Candidatus Fischerbacteria bacterium RBG_13_37_8]|uniref:Uncharacterized protein n=1 Tax=Candidatus Fischerbacteria bacterium RBG_13_37_8 TaxID=1817863 RepID=A0A1F5VD50_9BACT|nr:MAG: hypothetical protein A2Y62_15080 [Candidatus Fischerbacteria bacterium RBG_13_37_8]